MNIDFLKHKYTTKINNCEESSCTILHVFTEYGGNETVDLQRRDKLKVGSKF